MENNVIVTFQNYILAILGFAIYILLGMMKAKSSHKEGFNAMIWLEDNLLSIITSLISIIVVMISLPDLFKIGFVPKQFELALNPICAIIGFSNLALFKIIIDIWQPKKFRKTLN
jgi:hypothetical protein